MIVVNNNYFSSTDYNNKDIICCTLGFTLNFTQTKFEQEIGQPQTSRKLSVKGISVSE